MKRFIRRANIERFRLLLTQERDPEVLKRISELLAEEEAEESKDHSQMPPLDYQPRSRQTNSVMKAPR
jgi:hypothetical protein